jgi:hypothetical protein
VSMFPNHVHYSLPSHPIPHTHIRVSEHESLTHILSHPIPSLCTLAPKIRE